jgi:hypothetical protein
VRSIDAAAGASLSTLFDRELAAPRERPDRSGSSVGFEIDSTHTVWCPDACVYVPPRDYDPLWAVMSPATLALVECAANANAQGRGDDRRQDVRRVAVDPRESGITNQESGIRNR